MYEYIVLSGGGSKGLSYIGILQYLEEHNMIDKIKEYLGCSIGAFCALLMILGYKSKILIEIFDNYDLELLKNFKFSTFFDKYGLDEGKKITSFIKIFIKNKNLNENITLKQLYEKTNKKLITVATNINTKQTEFIDVERYPDIPVYLAVQMSMAIPFIYHPIKYNDQLYIDGGLTCNFPIRYYINNSDIDHSKILCFIFKETLKNDQNINTFDDYLYNVLISIFCCILDRDTIIAKKCSIVCININLSSNFNLNIGNDKKKELYKCGYEAIEVFLKNNNKTEKTPEMD